MRMSSIVRIKKEHLSEQSMQGAQTSSMALTASSPAVAKLTCAWGLVAASSAVNWLAVTRMRE